MSKDFPKPEAKVVATSTFDRHCWVWVIRVTFDSEMLHCHLPFMLKQKRQHQGGINTQLFQLFEGDILDGDSYVEVWISKALLFVLQECSFARLLLILEHEDFAVLVWEVLQGIPLSLSETGQSSIFAQLITQGHIGRVV